MYSGVHTFTPKASSCLVCLKQFKHLAYLPYVRHNTIVFIPIATPWKWATKKRICIEPKQQRASSCPSPAKPLKNSTSVPKTLECPETFAGKWAIPLPSPCLVSWSPRLRMLVSWWDGGVLVGRELPLCKNYPSSFLFFIIHGPNETSSSQIRAAPCLSSLVEWFRSLAVLGNGLSGIPFPARSSLHTVCSSDSGVAS